MPAVAAVAAERGLNERVGERDRCPAKAAFGGLAPDIPMRAAATGTMVNLIRAVQHMVAAVLETVGEAFAAEHYPVGNHHIGQHVSSCR